MPTLIATRGELRRRSTRRVPLPVMAGLALALVLMALSVGAQGGSNALAAGAVVPRCLAGQLSARIVDWQGAAGSRIADVQLVNTSFLHCSIRDLPRVQLVSAHGVVLINGAAASTTAHTHGLVPLGSLLTEVRAANYCGPAFARPVTLAFVLPGAAGRLVAIPVSPTDPADVPECLGAPGSAGQLEIHAWHP